MFTLLSTLLILWLMVGLVRVGRATDTALRLLDLAAADALALKRMVADAALPRPEP